MVMALEELIVLVGLAVVGMAHFLKWVVDELCDAIDGICKSIKRTFWKRR